MEKKETVILFRGQIESLLSLSSLKDVKTILRAIVLYGMDNETPEIPEHLTFGWLWFKNTIDSNREQYAARCDKNRTNAQKRWDKSPSMQSDATGCDGIRSDANDADNDNDNDINKERESITRICAQEAEKIAALYPKAKIGNWQQTVKSIIAAIQREMERGSSVIDSAALVELGTREYAKAAEKMKQKKFIFQAVKFFNDGIYNNDPETWEEPEIGNKKGGMRDDSSYSYTSKLG